MADGDQVQNNQQRGKLPLPTFAAEGTSASSISIDAEQFLSRFNDWASVCGFEGERKVKALGYALTDAAGNWHKQMSKRGKLSADDWAEVEREFRGRFVKAVSPRFIAGELNKLGQKPTESVADFLDRCELAQTLLDEQWAVEAGAAHRADRLQVTDSVHQVMVLHHFLRHLRPEIGDNLALCQNLTTLDEHVKAAERIEKAGTEKALAKNNVAAINEELAAIGGGQQRKKKKTPPPFYVCKICNVKGHYINDCPKSERQNRKRGQGQQQQQQQQQHSFPQQQQQQQPPRHLGAIPKSNQWQRPLQQPAAAMTAAPFNMGASGQPPAHLPQAVQMWQPPQAQSIYPSLPVEDFGENVSNLQAMQCGGNVAPAASPGWPALRSAQPGF